MELKELLQEAQTAADTIKVLTSSRRAPQPDMRTILAEIDPYQHAVMDVTKRPDKKTVVNLTDEMGMQMYDSAGNEMTKVEYVKVARVATSLQKIIVNRAVAFLFGNDVQYTADTETEQQDIALKAIKSAILDAKERSHNRRLAREVFTSTEAAELWYVTECEPHTRYGIKCNYKLRCSTFRPSQGDVLYPYFNRQGDLEAFSRKFEVYGADGARKAFFEAFTADAHYMFEQTAEGWQPMEGYPEKNVLGKIPVVYVSQADTEWGDVQPLIDRLETLLSNFADTNDYHASPKIFITGDIRGWGKKGESGQIIEGETGSNAQYLSWSQAPESVKTEMQSLLNLIYTETQTPDISFDSVKGLGAQSGIALKLMFMDAHLKVQDKMEYFSEALARRVSIIKSILAGITTDASIKSALNDIVVDAEVRPYILTDDSAELQMLMAATANKAIMSRRTAIQRAGYVSDVDKELEQIDGDEAGNMGNDLVDAYADQ